MFIYSITNIKNGRVYIGKTEKPTINRRWIVHKNKLKTKVHQNKSLQSDYDLYGALCFKYSIVEKCSAININDREIYYIALYNATDINYGYNKSKGGIGTTGIPMPKQTRDAIRKANLGKPLSDYQKAVLLKYNTGRIISESTIEKFKIVGKERAKTQQFKDMVKANGLKSYKKVKEQFELCNEQRKKAVICINNGKVYNSLTLAAIDLGLDKTNISRVANGKQIQAKGFKFKWAA